LGFKSSRRRHSGGTSSLDSLTRKTLIGRRFLPLAVLSSESSPARLFLCLVLLALGGDGVHAREHVVADLKQHVRTDAAKIGGIVTKANPLGFQPGDPMNWVMLSLVELARASDLARRLRLAVSL